MTGSRSGDELLSSSPTNLFFFFILKLISGGPSPPVQYMYTPVQSILSLSMSITHRAHSIELVRKNHKIFIKFCIVGLINTFIHYFLAVSLIKSGYSFFLANLGGFSCALINSFYLNAIFTFNKPINFNAFQSFN